MTDKKSNISPKFSMDIYGSLKAAFASIVVFFAAIQLIEGGIGIAVISGSSNLSGSAINATLAARGITANAAYYGLIYYVLESAVVAVVGIAYYLRERKMPGRLGRGWILIWVLESWIVISYVGVVIELITFYFVWTKGLHLKNPYRIK